MKKILIVLSALLVFALLCGCGKAPAIAAQETVAAVQIPLLEGAPREVNTAGHKEYTLDSGVHFYGPRGLKESEIDGMAAYMKGTYFVFMVIEEPRAGTVLEDATLEEYAAMLSRNNGLDSFVTDCYGSLATTNRAPGEEEGDMFFYYVTVSETPDSFLLVQIACPEEIADESIDSLALWSATVTMTEPEE